MQGNQNKRFWVAVEVAREENGYSVRLDGKPVRVPGAGMLLSPHRALAEAIASEWRDAGGGAPGGPYEPDAIGLTRLAGSMLFRVAPDRTAVIERLGGFLDNELLCYRATHPRPLVVQQEREWTPWLDWCRNRFGAALAVTDGVMPIQQDRAAHEAIGRALASQDDAGLTALGALSSALNSLVLALACVDGALPARDAHALSSLDDRFQADQWGRDAEAWLRQERLLSDCLEAERFLVLARTRDDADEHDTLLLVEGLVQGVGFRVWLQREAEQLGLRGWVRNLTDGRVEARLRGPAEARMVMVRRSAEGPRGAAVRGVTSRDVTAREALADGGSFAVAATASQPE